MRIYPHDRSQWRSVRLEAHPGHPRGMIPPAARRRTLGGMNGWLLWGFLLPVLLVVAGIIQLQRNKRR